MTFDWELAVKAIGYGGQLCFGLRFLVQWVSSERAKRTVVPPVFWYLSLCGATAMMVYGGIRRDDVIVLGQLPGVFVYLRNLIIRGRAASGR